MKHKNILIVLPAVLVLLGLLSLRSPVAHAATNDIVVNTASDADPAVSSDGQCTLREAITNLADPGNQDSGTTPGDCAAAVGDGSDRIIFNISGSPDYTIQDKNGVTRNGYTIMPVDTLPDIQNKVTIDGYSQPGSSANTNPTPQPFNGALLIQLDGENTSGSNGLNVVSSAGGTQIRGLVINRFQTGIGPSRGASNVVIAGNYIGSDPTGMTKAGTQGVGIHLGDGLHIGGLNPQDRNIVGGWEDTGASPTFDNNWLVEGNYFGLAADGKTPLPNSATVNGSGSMSIDNSNGTQVGGLVPGAMNVFSGNNSQAFIPDHATNLIIEGNMIGPDWQGKPIPASTQQGGIGLFEIAGTIDKVIIRDNTIAYNNGPGISIPQITLPGPTVHTATNVAILGNSIYGNQVSSLFNIGITGLGIDIFSFGLDNSFTPVNIIGLGTSINDTGDVDTGPNDFLNHPLISDFKQSGSTATTDFDLDTAGASTGQYRVEFFATDNNTQGQGKTFLGYVNAAAGLGQKKSFTLPTGINLTNQYITATATQINGGTANEGFGATSEFSDPASAVVTQPTAPNTGTASISSKYATRLFALGVGLSLSSYGLFAITKRRLINS